MYVSLNSNWGCAWEGRCREWAIVPGDSEFRARKRLVAEGMTEGGATEPSFDFGGAVPQEVVAVNGLSIPMTDSSLSELKYSVRRT